MSSSVAESEAGVCCANCGIAEVDDIKLEDCDNCDLVKYCGDKCKDGYRERHEEECRKRKALLHDRKLFTQPDISHLGECPLCFLPLPFDRSKSFFRTCCSELICNGCFYANVMANKHDKAKALGCPFCREPADVEATKKRLMKRIKANDPAALSNMGLKCYDKGDYDGAFKYWTKAAELEDVEAHFHLGRMYEDGEGVEKDEEKSINHLEKAAIGGHPEARNNLACIEAINGNMERSVEHFIIAAKLGCEISMKGLWRHYSAGHITKEDLDATLRSHQAAIDETKSEQRSKAEEFDRRRSQSR
jgi:tetratricopeptide (TPR) repeat protein